MLSNLFAFFALSHATISITQHTTGRPSSPYEYPFCFSFASLRLPITPHLCATKSPSLRQRRGVWGGDSLPISSKIADPLPIFGNLFQHKNPCFQRSFTLFSTTKHLHSITNLLSTTQNSSFSPGTSKAIADLPKIKRDKSAI